MRVAYVIATHRPRQDFLVEHFTRLYALKHSLDSVIVVCNEVNGGDARTVALASSADLLTRPNIYGSYGAWAHAIVERPDFDAYILVEDDYVFTHDHFDRLLVDKIQREPDIGFYCGLVRPTLEGRDHAAIALGIVPRAAAVAAVSRFIQLMPPPTSLMTQLYVSQVNFSYAFVDSGFKLRDWTEEYGSLYWMSEEGKAKSWWPRSEEERALPLKRHFVVPIQALRLSATEITNGSYWRSVRVNPDGSEST